jgi:hypothetical protein
MGHGQLYSILGSYSIPGIFPSITRPKLLAQEKFAAFGNFFRVMGGFLNPEKSSLRG